MGLFRSRYALRLLTLLPLSYFTAAYSYDKPAANSYGIKVNTHSTPNIGVETSDDTTYTVDITLGGRNFTVLLDTGSTDLWIDSKGLDLELTNTTNLPVTELYGRGEVHGTLQFAELKVGEYVVPSQAFVNATQVLDFGVPVDGIMGMAFDVSFIFADITRTWGRESATTLGRSFITNLFAENSSLPNNFDIQLGREDAVEDGSGTFVISGHAPSFVDVADAPKIPRIGTDRWTFALDEMRVNGESVAFNRSSVAGAPDGKLVALLDTGFSFPPLPPAAVDAIYKTIPGSVFSPPNNAYFVPCNSTTMLSFFLGGKEFPVHPLDLTFPFATTVPTKSGGVQRNVTACLGTYQPITLDPTAFAGFDLALGDAFLRNAYVSFDYGDFDPLTDYVGNPFVQMVPTTDSRTAIAEFYDERGATLASLPPTIDPAEYLRLWAAASSTSSSSSGSDSELEDSTVSGALFTDDVLDSARDGSDGTFGKAVLGLLAANLVVGLALLGVTVTMCVRGKGGKDVGSRYVPVRFKDAEATGRGAEYDAAHRYGS